MITFEDLLPHTSRKYAYYMVKNAIAHGVKHRLQQTTLMSNNCQGYQSPRIWRVNFIDLDESIVVYKKLLGRDKRVHVQVGCMKKLHILAQVKKDYNDL